MRYFKNSKTLHLVYSIEVQQTAVHLTTANNKFQIAHITHVCLAR